MYNAVDQAFLTEECRPRHVTNKHVSNNSVIAFPQTLYEAVNGFTVRDARRTLLLHFFLSMGIGILCFRSMPLLCIYA